VLTCCGVDDDEFDDFDDHDVDFLLSQELDAEVLR